MSENPNLPKNSQLQGLITTNFMQEEIGGGGEKDKVMVQ